MNTYQSPYIDGQVVDAEATGPTRKAAETPPLPAAQPDTKINGCTRSASDCLHKTTKLAREFNHGTVSAAHLVLAMTLIPNASRQFEMRKMDIDRAFRAAMHALMEIERGTPSSSALPSVSEEFNMIVTLAQELAQNRDNQEVSVDDLLTALERLPQDSSAAQLIRGERKYGAAEQASDQAVEQLAASLAQHFDQMNQQFQETRRLIDALRLDLPGEDVVRLKTYLQHRDGVLEQTINTAFAELAKRFAANPSNATEPSSAPDPMTQDPSEDSLWEKIFGKKQPDIPPSPGMQERPSVPQWRV